MKNINTKREYFVKYSLFQQKKNHQISKNVFEVGSNFNWLHFLTSGHLILSPSQKLAMTQQHKIEIKIKITGPTILLKFNIWTM
jgi:hypothetical protein